MSGRSIVLVWENFGPMHADRAEAVARRLWGRREVVGIELASQSDTYDWRSESGDSFRKITLFEETKIGAIPALTRFWRTLLACLSLRGDYFFCHYEHPATFLVAIILRLLGRNIFVMNDSKFDDYPRFFWREFGKRIMYFPYIGGVASGVRARDYLRFLGVPESKIAVNYNGLSIDRIRRLAGAPCAPNGTLFVQRHFTIVARFVPKKNLSMALDAYALYRRSVKTPRPLHFCGSGELESQLRQKVYALGLEELTVFHGFVQTAEIARTLATTLALLLPSKEEQFGNVVIEAQAMGLPVILSENCGARDMLVRSGVNGFVVEPDNPKGMAYFMEVISEDEALWRRMSYSASETTWFGDAAVFAEAIASLVGEAEPINSLTPAKARELADRLAQFEP